MKSSFTVRAEKVDLDSWHEAAKVSDMSISEWARRAMNKEVASGHKSNSEKAPVEVRNSSPRKRSGGKSGGDAVLGRSSTDHPAGCRCQVCKFREEVLGSGSVRKK